MLTLWQSIQETSYCIESWGMYAGPVPIFTPNSSPQTFTYLSIITDAQLYPG